MRRPSGGTVERHSLLSQKCAGLIIGVLIFAASPGPISLQASDKKDEAVAWPEITEQESALKSVPQDPEADAVILRRTRQGKIVEENHFVTNYLDYHWRMKILNERGRK